MYIRWFAGQCAMRTIRARGLLAYRDCRALQLALTTIIALQGFCRIPKAGAEQSNAPDLKCQSPFIELEQGWARSLREGGEEQLNELLVDDFVRVDAEGRLHDRRAYLADISSRRLRLEQCNVEGVKARTRGDFAVVAATVGVVGACEDRDISAFYQVTDTFLLRAGKWQAFSRNETRITSRTDPLWERVGKPNGKPRIVLFVLGSFCPQCMTQLMTFAKDLAGRQCGVTVVSADTEDDLKKFPDMPFMLVADPEHKLFRRFGAFESGPKHATVALDGRGNLVFKTVGEKPYMNAEVVGRWIDDEAARDVVRPSDSSK
jgi:peroxiredoxin